MAKNGYFFPTKKRFLNPIFIFFQKIELIQRKTTQMNTFLRGIKKSAKIGQQKEGQVLGRKNSKKRGNFSQKMDKFSQKMGIFYTKKRFLNPIFIVFQKIELIQRKTTQMNTFPRGITKSSKICRKN